MLAYQYPESLRAALKAFAIQKSMAVEIRSSSALHDRVVFVDDRSCWVLGQSLKDAAKTKPTYLAPLAADAFQLKREAYEAIWATGQPL